MHVNGGQMGSIKKNNISHQNGIFHCPVGGGASGTEFKIKVKLFPWSFLANTIILYLRAFFSK